MITGAVFDLASEIFSTVEFTPSAIYPLAHMPIPMLGLFRLCVSRAARSRVGRSQAPLRSPLGATYISRVREESNYRAGADAHR